IEGPCLIAVLLPGLGEAGDEVAGLVHVDELVVDVLVDLERGVELGIARIHVDGLVHGGHAQRAPALGGAAAVLVGGVCAGGPPAGAPPGGAPPPGPPPPRPRRGGGGGRGAAAAAP